MIDDKTRKRILACRLLYLTVGEGLYVRLRLPWLNIVSKPLPRIWFKPGPTPPGPPPVPPTPPGPPAPPGPPGPPPEPPPIPPTPPWPPGPPPPWPPPPGPPHPPVPPITHKWYDRLSDEYWDPSPALGEIEWQSDYNRWRFKFDIAYEDLTAKGDWNQNFTPTKCKVTWSGPSGSKISIEVRDVWSLTCGEVHDADMGTVIFEMEPCFFGYIYEMGFWSETSNQNFYVTEIKFYA